MAGIEKSLVDELYLKLAEDEDRRKHKTHKTERNSDYSTKPKAAKEHMQRSGSQKSGSNFDMKTPKNVKFENSAASISEVLVPNSKFKQNREIHHSSKKEMKYLSGIDADKVIYQDIKENNLASCQMVNRKQTYHLNSKMYKIGTFEGSVQTKQLQGSTREYGRSHYSSYLGGVKEYHSQIVRRLDFKRLQVLCNSTPTDIVTFLISSNSGFKELLELDLEHDLLILVVKVLAKACTCNLEANQAALLSITCETHFLDSIQNYVFIMHTDDSVERQCTIGNFITDLLIFYEAVMNKLPNTASEKFKNIFISTEIMLKSVETYQTINLYEQKEKFAKLHERLQDMIQERLSKNLLTCSKEELQKFSAPPDDFRGISVYPTLEDLFGEKTPFLRPNITDGTYMNVEHYLDVQFRLLREDFVSPLREGLAKFSDKSLHTNKRYQSNNIKIYKNVQFGIHRDVNNSLGIIVHFDCKKELNIKLKDSKRLMFGSLLLFTNDNFKNVLFGTVVERKIKKSRHGRLIVNLQENHNINIFESNFLMIESEVYFEPYKHVMKALQRFDEFSFPMKEYIIFVKKESPPPLYISRIPYCKYKVNGITIEILNDNSWPRADTLGLDKAQFAAFKAALRKEFVIIQGPPGTGKTFLGLKIAKVLLENATIWNVNKSPILVVCYTNHALDQFLEGLLPATDKIVRVGSQSKSVSMMMFNLREKRRKFKSKNSNFHLEKKKYFNTLREIMTSLKIIKANLEELQLFRGIVSINFMNEYNIISPQHYLCFKENGYEEDRTLYEWLKQGFREFYNNTERGRRIFEDVSSKDYYSDDIEEDEVSGTEEEGEEEEEEDDDDEFSELHYITHNIKYSMNFETKIHNISEGMKRYHSAKEHSLKEMQEECWHLQQMLQYWKTCLKMNQHCEAAYVERLHSIQNLWQLSTQDRLILYKDWLNSLKNALLRKMNKYEEEYRYYTEECNKVKQLTDLEIMEDSLVVGMTTTSAARLQNLLQTLKPKIVIVEEAAEVLESHVIASLNNKCQQVILIGDHKQLRPNPAVYRLARHYRFDVSLFERMVNNGLQCHCLENQHRMRPEISQLIAPTIYPDLKNDSSVYKYSTVRGITKSLFFLTHNAPEVTEITSHKNSFEADFILALCQHLMYQGYKPEEITILATYKAQMKYMKQKQTRLGILNGVLISVVDNYQGEENKIILLSLVRSNKDAKIGFLSIENRVCVALSRAREGLYIVGNMHNLVKSSKIWVKIKDSLVKQESYGTYLTLQCEIHPDQHTMVNCADDFKQVPNGGCSLLCNALLQCGHRCESICHANDREHKIFICKKRHERLEQKGRYWSPETSRHWHQSLQASVPSVPLAEHQTGWNNICILL